MQRASFWRRGGWEGGWGNYTRSRGNSTVQAHRLEQMLVYNTVRKFSKAASARRHPSPSESILYALQCGSNFDLRHIMSGVRKAIPRFAWCTMARATSQMSGTFAARSGGCDCPCVRHIAGSSHYRGYHHSGVDARALCQWEHPCLCLVTGFSHYPRLL